MPVDHRYFLVRRIPSDKLYDMKIHLAESDFWQQLGDDFRKRYVAELGRSYRQAAKLLPFGAPHVNFFVQPRTYGLIADTHDDGHTYNSEFITIAFDPDYFGKQSPEVLGQHISGTVFHEINHAARLQLGIWHETFLDNCIMEGLATVFERDYAHTKPAWADYPLEVTDWLAEIERNQQALDYRQYMYSHPDGRKYIGYKVGTYIVDRAVQKSGESVVGLTQLECRDILALA